MADLPNTFEALAEIPANRHFGYGQHPEHMVRSTALGRQLGYTEFDANLHSPDQIDPFSLLGMALEQDMVPIVEPVRPLVFNVVTDFSAATEYAGVTAAKRAVARDMAHAIDDSRDMTDLSFLYLVGDDVPTQGVPHHDILQNEKGDVTALSANVEEIAQNGLTFVVSDFSRLRLPDTARFDDLIAIKVNHLLERQVPAKVGRISLGGLAVVDTDKPRQLAKVNHELEERHQAIVAGLEARGAQVASVITAPKYLHKYDVTDADKQIAGAIRVVSNR